MIHQVMNCHQNCHYPQFVDKYGANIYPLSVKWKFCRTINPIDTKPIVVINELENGVDLVESKELKEIAKKFKVSEQALCFRLGNLGFI